MELSSSVDFSEKRRSTALMRASTSRGAEGLDDIVVRAQFQAEDAVDLFALGREHDDGDGTGLANGAANVDAGHARHHQIQHHHVRVQAFHHFQGLLSVVCGLVLIPFRTEVQPQRLMHHRIVVADQDQRVHRHILTSKAHICTVFVLLLYTLSRSNATVVEKSLNKIIFDSILKPERRRQASYSGKMAPLSSQKRTRGSLKSASPVTRRRYCHSASRPALSKRRER